MTNDRDNRRRTRYQRGVGASGCLDAPEVGGVTDREPVFTGEFSDSATHMDINEILSALRSKPGVEVRERDDGTIEVVR